MSLLTYDPTVDTDEASSAAALRPTTLDGATVGLLANGRSNSDRLLENVLELLRQRYQIADVIRQRYRSNELEAIYADLAEKSDLVITAVGD